MESINLFWYIVYIEWLILAGFTVGIILSNVNCESHRPQAAKLVIIRRFSLVLSLLLTLFGSYHFYPANAFGFSIFMMMSSYCFGFIYRDVWGKGLIGLNHYVEWVKRMFV